MLFSSFEIKLIKLRAQKGFICNKYQPIRVLSLIDQASSQVLISKASKPQFAKSLFRHGQG